MSNKSGGVWQGWPLVGIAAAVVCLGAILILQTAPDQVEGVRRVIRATARSSVTLFLLAFTASAAWRFWPNAWTGWQRRNRRYLGVSFAVSHGVHLLAIVALGQVAPEQLAAELDLITLIFGGLAYAFIAALTATSFDRTARMIGPRAWKILHTVGSYYIWIIFANGYISRAVMEPEYIPVAALVVFALGLRIAARVARRRAQQPAAAGSS